MLSEAAGRDGEGYRKLTPTRLRLVLAAAAIIGAGIGSADWAVKILYDPRYEAAGWMLSILLVASWLSILSNLNEAVLLGSGKPAYESGGNVIRFCILAVGLWVGYGAAGFAGAIFAVIFGEAGRYAFIQFGQQRYKLSYLRQDILATLTLFGVLAAWLAARHFLGLGAPWDVAFKGR
jgi:O-antigen/teichoic acid export membrane protein